MAEKLITQQELAEKYDCDQGTVSLALSLAGVFKREMTGQGRSRKYLYNEREAASALRKLYRKRADNYKKLADEWRTRAFRVELIFEEGEDET